MLNTGSRIAMLTRVKVFGCMKVCLRSSSNKAETSSPVAIVTGSSSGIGRSIAKGLVRNGYRVTIHGRDPKTLSETAELCLAEGAEEDDILCLEGNLLNDNFLEQLPNETLKKFGRIDALINNAGVVNHPDKMAAFDVEVYDRIMSTNLRAPVVLSKHSLEALKRTKGSILNISSVVVNSLRMFNYCISKAGLEQFSRCLALELASDGVRVNCIRSGAAFTPLWVRYVSFSDEWAEQLEHNLAKYFHPMEGLTTEEDITNAVTFLLSEKASFITGAILPVCGGAQLPYDGRVLQYKDEMNSRMGKNDLEHNLTKYFHPMEGLTTEEDITNAVTFLFSEKASFITGAILPVCGGAQLPYDGRVLQYKDEMNSRMGKNDVSQ